MVLLKHLNYLIGFIPKVRILNQLNIVKMPREAVLDSEFLSLASQLGVEKSSRLHTGFKTFDPNELITKIRYALLKEASVDVAQEIENENIDNWNWNGLGKTASSLFLRVPSFTSLYDIVLLFSYIRNGALVSERPEKPKKERQKREKDKVGTRINPEEVYSLLPLNERSMRHKKTRNR